MGIRTPFNPLGGMKQKAFVFTVAISSAAYEMALPVNNATYVNPINVDWGDGTKERLTGGTYPTHIYADAGYYQIIVSSSTGNIPYLYFNCNTSGNISAGRVLIRIDSCNITWYDATTKTEIFRNMFSGCGSLTSIPSGLFDNNTMASVFDSTFYGCSRLTSIPSLLFNNNTRASSFHSTFIACNSATIPSDLFCPATDKTTRFATVTPNFTNCFSRATWSGTTAGTAPDLWNYTYAETPITTNCFGRAGNSATSLTNYADIPAEWI